MAEAKTTGAEATSNIFKPVNNIIDNMKKRAINIINSNSRSAIAIKGLVVTLAIYAASLVLKPFEDKNFHKENTDFITMANNKEKPPQEKIVVAGKYVLSAKGVNYSNGLYTEDERLKAAIIIITASYDEDISELAANFLEGDDRQKFIDSANLWSDNRDKVVFTKMVYKMLHSVGLEDFAKKIINRNKNRNRNSTIWVNIFEENKKSEHRTLNNIPYLVVDELNGGIIEVRKPSDDPIYSDKTIPTGNNDNDDGKQTVRTRRVK